MRRSVSVSAKCGLWRRQEGYITPATAETTRLPLLPPLHHVTHHYSPPENVGTLLLNLYTNSCSGVKAQTTRNLTENTVTPLCILVQMTKVYSQKPDHNKGGHWSTRVTWDSAFYSTYLQENFYNAISHSKYTYFVFIINFAMRINLPQQRSKKYLHIAPTKTHSLAQHRELLCVYFQGHTLKLSSQYHLCIAIIKLLHILKL